MFDKSIGLIDNLSFSESDKQILRDLLGNCQRHETTSKPIDFTGDVTFNNETIQNIINQINQSGGSTNFTAVRFKLDDPLSLGGSAGATIQEWDGASWVDGASITVYDFYGDLGHVGEWQAPSGYCGYAVKLDDKSEYQILNMEHQALFAWFTATEDMGGTMAGQMAVTFDSFTQGRTVGAETNVYDRQGKYTTVVTGDKGVAAWDNKLGKYQILSMDDGSGGGGGGGSGVEPILFRLDGANLSRGGSCAAKKRTWDSGSSSWIDGGSITVYDSSWLGPGFDGNFGLCYLSTLSAHYEVLAIMSNAMCRFRLTADLDFGGSASAVIKLYDPGSGNYVDGDTITVHDAFGEITGNGMCSGKTGYWGYAIQLLDKAQWQVVNIEKTDFDLCPFTIGGKAFSPPIVDVVDTDLVPIMRPNLDGDSAPILDADGNPTYCAKLGRLTLDCCALDTEEP